MLRTISATICAASLVTTTSNAAETITYTYDPHGRMTQLQVAGGPSNGVIRSYQFDPTNNRTGFQLSGSAGGGPVTITPSSAVANETSIGVTLGVTINGNSPTGIVTFTENGQFLGSAFPTTGKRASSSRTSHSALTPSRSPTQVMG